MKRFALKRITALVLALIMTLSLLPMNVWAAETEGEPEYQKLYMNKGHDTEENANYVETHRLDVGSSEYLWLFVDENGVKTGVTGDYTPNVVGTNGSIGTLTFEDGQGKGFKWDTTGATASEGFLEVSKAGSPVYRMPVTVNLNPGANDNDQPSGETFSAKGVYIFTGMEEGIPNYDGSLSEAGGVVTIPSGNFDKRIFVATESDLMVGASWPSGVAFNCANPSTWSGYNLYEMVVTGQESGKVDVPITGIGNGGAEMLILPVPPCSGMKAPTWASPPPTRRNSTCPWTPTRAIPPWQPRKPIPIPC